MAAPTKTTAEVDECAEVAQNAVREGADIDMTTAFGGELHISLALTTETAHTGSRVIVQTSGNSEGNEDWEDLWDAVYLIGTAALENTDDDPAAIGTTVFAVTSTTGFVADGVLDIFLEDVDTFANSEWMKLVSHEGTPSITVQDASTRAHAVDSIFYNKARRIIVPIDMNTVRARILYDNTYDPDGSTIACKSRVVKVTAIA